MAFVAIAALIVIYLKAGEATGMLLRCPIHLLTGYSCPGCGSQRAMLCLLHLDIPGAIRSNYILLPALIYLVMLGVGYRVDRFAGMYRRLTQPWAIYLVIGVIAGWTVLRNFIGV